MTLKMNDTSETKDNGPNTLELENASHHHSSPAAEEMASVDADVAGRTGITFRKYMAMLSFQLGYLAGIFTLVSIGNLTIVINKSIGPSDQYTWMANAFILSAGILAPIVGRLGDIFGRRTFFIVADAFAILGAGLMAGSHSVNMFIAGSVMSGIGLSMQQLAFAAVSELVQNKHRALALGILEMSLAPAAGFGPVIAEALTIHATWRWAFWLILIFNALALGLVIIFYHPIQKRVGLEGETKLQQLLQMDYVGAAMFIAGLTLLLVGLSFGGISYPWRNAHVIAPIVIGILLLIALGLYESFVPMAYPLFPPHLFRLFRAFTLTNFCIFLVGMCYYSGQIIWPQEIQALFTTNRISVGWYTSALSFGGCIFGPILGYANQKLGYSRWFLIFSTAGLTLGTGLGALVSTHSQVRSTVSVVLIGMFSAATKIMTTAMIQLGVPDEYIGMATSINIMVLVVGGSVGTTIYTAILQNYESAHLPVEVAKAALAQGLPMTSLKQLLLLISSGDASAAASIPGITPAILLAAAEAAKQVSVIAFKRVYLVSIAFGAVCVVASLFTLDLNDMMTDHVATTINHNRGALRQSARASEPPEKV